MFSKLIFVSHVLVAHKAGLTCGSVQLGDEGIGEAMSTPCNDIEPRLRVVMKG
jgi:hypothetical protein